MSIIPSLVTAGPRWHKVIAAFFAIALWPSSGPALRPEEETPARRNAALARPTTEPGRKTPSSAQKHAASLARDEGVELDWDETTGAPSRVRGKDLETSATFTGARTFVAPATDLPGRAVGVLENLAPLFGIQNAAAEFAPRGKVQTDELGFKHQRITQVHRGLPVVGADLTVHFGKDGVAYQVGGRYVRDLRIDPTPKIPFAVATAAAEQDLAQAGFLKVTLTEGPVLVIYAHGETPAIAYELVFQAGPENIWHYWIHAGNGAVLNKRNEVEKIAPPSNNGSSATLRGTGLAGEGSISWDFTGWFENSGAYYLYNKSLFFFVYNAASSGYSDSSTYAFRSTSNWGLSDRVEISAMVNMNFVQSYFRTIHNRQSVDNSNTYIPGHVHHGNRYVNAFWDGERMVFGDGDGFTANPLCVLDVTGHEMTHGVIQYTADLVYQGESGALNESFADIFGTVIEFFAQADGSASYPNVTPGRADWLIGEDCWISSKALRDMRNPRSTVTIASGSQQPSRYKGTYWYFGSGDNGGVHYNSGVQNFFFYLLCQGGSGSNDGINYSLTGIGIDNARLIAYRALTVYCTSTTNYNGVRNAWVSAAQDLNAAWVPAVQAAWSAVGVGSTTTTVAEPVFTPPPGSYASSLSVSISTATAGASIRYTLNGTQPTESSALYSAPISIFSDTIITAKAFKSGMTPSSSTVAQYRFLGTLLHDFPLNTSPGWATSGGWAFGPPAGGGGAHGNPDPPSARTGTNVYGYNLAGDYADSIASTQWLTTRAIDFSNASNVKLTFWRWLGVEQPSYDHAYVQVSRDGAQWTTLFTNTSEVTDTAWTFITYDISAVADGQATVYVRWGMGTTDGSWTYCGWNIDDVQFWGTATSTPRPPTAPSALTGSPLSSTQVLLNWEDKSNNEERFAIERKTGSAAFVEIDTAAANTTSFQDDTVAANRTYLYRVRAVNDAGPSGYTNEVTVNTPAAAGDAWDPADNTAAGGTTLAGPAAAEQSHGAHTLSGTDTADWFKVTLAAGVEYNFNSAGGAGDTYAQLYSDAGVTRVASDDDSAGGLQFSITFTPPSSGTYYLHVRSFDAGDPASYTLKYRGAASTSGGDAWDPGDDAAAGATDLGSPGSPATHGPHSLGANDLYDWFSVELTGGVSYILEGINGTGDTYAELFSDRTGTVRVAFDDDTGAGVQFRLLYTAANSGTYYLRVRTYLTGSAATYTLERSLSVVGRDAWDPRDDAIRRASTLNAPTSSTQVHEPHGLTGRDYSDWFRVYLEAGVHYQFDTAGGVGDVVGALFRIVRGRARAVVGNDDGAGNGQFRIDFTPGRTGVYFLRVVRYSRYSSARYPLNYRIVSVITAAAPPPPDEEAIKKLKAAAPR
jgi:bacillolysin